MIYSDNAYQIYCLENTPGLEIVAEVFKDSGKRIAVLFQEVNVEYGEEKESGLKTGS